MARVPEEMSEAQGRTDVSRARIEGRAYPVLQGPGPVLTTMLAVASVTVGLAIWPKAGMFLLLAAVLFLATAGTAFRLRANARRGDFAVVAVLASLCFAWAYMVYFEFSVFSRPLHVLVLLSGALALGLARYLRCYRYAWDSATEAAVACDCDTLANYAEFLLDKRPGPAAPQIAREFYRLASEEVLYYLEPSPRHSGIIKRYIDLLRTGTGGPADIAEAKWWQDRLNELEGGAPCPPLTGMGHELPDPIAGISDIPDGDGTLHLARGRPIWRISVADPQAAATGAASIGFQPFLLPEGAVIACLLCLHGGSAGPAVRYRAFDISDPAAEAFLMALEHRLSWRIEFTGTADRGTGRGARAGKKPRRIISLTGSGLMEGLEAGFRHNRESRSEPDGARALARFTAAIEEAARKSDLLSAWTDLESKGLQNTDE